MISAREGGVSLVNLLFGYSGRINRMQFWLGSLGSGFAGGFIVSFITFAMMGAEPTSKEAVSNTGPLLLVLWGVLSVVLGWIGMALQWKRFHDRGRPGWLALAPLLPVTMVFVTVASGVTSGANPMATVSSAMMWVMLLLPINLWFFIDLGCLAGEAGANKYGDPPGSGGGYLPRAPAAPSSAAPAAMSSSLFGAQTAMERAIAEQAQARVAPQPAMATTGAPAANGGPSFGRKAR